MARELLPIGTSKLTISSEEVGGNIRNTAIDTPMRQSVPRPQNVNMLILIIRFFCLDPMRFYRNC